MPQPGLSRLTTASPDGRKSSPLGIDSPAAHVVRLRPTEVGGFVIRPGAPVTGDGQNAGAVDLLADVLRATGRRSDAIGRVGPGEFAVIAPGTDRGGAVLLAERLARAVARASGEGTRAPGLRAGYDAVANARYTPIEPKNLLARATTALRAAKGQGGPNWIQGFGG